MFELVERISSPYPLVIFGQFFPLILFIVVFVFRNIRQEKRSNAMENGVKNLFIDSFIYLFGSFLKSTYTTVVRCVYV